MTQTLLTGTTGLLAFQQQLDVVANNIANQNTTGYKTQRALFSDLLYNTLENATGSESALFGGTNPKQVGFGVELSQINRDFSQGLLENTGQAFDFAIDGDGFFVISGNEQAFTRAGAFSVDESGFLVDPATGGFVQRFGNVGEGTGNSPAFQTAGVNNISIPLGASVAGGQTTESSFIGNLPASAEIPQTEVLTSSAPFTASGAAATLTTPLNDLDTNVTNYQTGDAIEVLGTNVDGSSFSATIAAGPTTTLADIVNGINAQIVGAVASVAPDGNLLVTATESGDALLSVTIQDAAANVGGTNFGANTIVVGTDGQQGDTVESTIQIFDSRGEPHSINVTFEKQDFNRWDATFSSIDPNVQLPDNQVTSILFNEDGTFQAIAGTGTGDANIELTIDGITTTQPIEFTLDRLTHLATDFTATFDQDGFPPGNIVSINVSPEGILTGIATNGQQLEIAQLAVASFNNNQGLEAIGQNYFTQTSNSGQPQIGAPESAGSGLIRSGQLESSNVDVALEFTQLIVAQRGFSANARSITIATEILSELNNLFR